MNSYMQIIRQKHSGRIPVLLSEKGNFFCRFLFVYTNKIATFANLVSEMEKTVIHQIIR